LVSQDFNITIIEVNNPPKFNVSVETILSDDLLYTIGDDRIFYYDLGSYLVSQLEETQTSNLVFNLTYVNGSLSPFNIDSNGIINITGNESLILGGNESWSYYLNLSVYDTGLSMRTSLHPNKTNCYGPEYNEDPRSWSSDFWLTVTKENRAPVITSYYPLEFNLSISGVDTLYFNLTARDSDYTPLDVYWYVDEVVKESMSGLKEENVSEFEYIFGCGVGGEHKIKALVTDGLANDSIEFNLSVAVSGCPVPPSGGGGGGGSRVFCEEKWGCAEWMQCQNLINLSESGWASKETELSIKERCGLFEWEEEFCGFQQRLCQDFNYCNTEKTKPGVIKECYYTENPTCNDNIKNCHENDCEVLVDCGGPCKACPTCDDKIKNQNEEGIDCGGVCEPCIEAPMAPRIIKSVILYSLFLLLLLVLFLVAKQTIKYYRGKKTFQTSKIKNRFIRKGVEGFKKRNVLKSLFFIGFVIVLLSLSNFYIIRVAQTNAVISDVFGGVMASYGLINSFFKGLGLFFISAPAVNGNTRLQIWDDTEGYLFERVERSGDLIYFYANYTDNTPGSYAPLAGDCDVRVQDSGGVYGPRVAMNYNLTSELFEYTQIINYKGDYLFNVNCSFLGLDLEQFDNFVIINTAPEINVDRGGIYIDFDGDEDNTDYWGCIEDALCVYDFYENITDPDTNDVWTYFVETSNTSLTNYVLNSATGIL
ncbi:MAG: hypothetical protein ACW98D_21460, partial [Promethearchaeota archaeon]